MICNPLFNREYFVSITYYVALPFDVSEEGDLVLGEAKDYKTRSADVMAELMVRTQAGAIAFSRMGDLATGEFEPAVILGRYGGYPGRGGVTGLLPQIRSSPV